MYLLDIAVAPMYSVIGGTLLLIIAAAVAIGVVFGAVNLIKKAISKNKEE